MSKLKQIITDIKQNIELIKQDNQRKREEKAKKQQEAEAKQLQQRAEELAQTQQQIEKVKEASYTLARLNEEKKKLADLRQIKKEEEAKLKGSSGINVEKILGGLQQMGTGIQKIGKDIDMGISQETNTIFMGNLKDFSKKKTTKEENYINRKKKSQSGL